MSVHIRGIGPDGQWLTKAERNDVSDEPRRYLCERCGGTGQQEAGCWDGKAYAAPAGTCSSCEGAGSLGVIERNDMRHEFMSAVEATPGDAIARLEVWHLSGEGRHSFINTVICEFIVEIDDDELTVQRCGSSLSDTIHAALDQWEETQ